MHWTGVSAEHAVKARLVNDRLLAEPELRSNRVVKVVQAYTQEVRVLMAEIRDIGHFLFSEGMNFTELPTSSGLRELGGPQGSAHRPEGPSAKSRPSAPPGEGPSRAGKEPEQVRRRESRQGDGELDSDAGVEPTPPPKSSGVKRKFTGSPGKVNTSTPIGGFTPNYPGDRAEVPRNHRTLGTQAPIRRLKEVAPARIPPEVRVTTSRERNAPEVDTPTADTSLARHAPMEEDFIAPTPPIPDDLKIRSTWRRTTQYRRRIGFHLLHQAGLDPEPLGRPAIHRSMPILRSKSGWSDHRISWFWTGRTRNGSGRFIGW